MFQRVFDSSWRSLYAVVAGTSIGTAFAFGGKNLIATARYVIEGKDLSQAVLLKTIRERRQFRLEKVAEDPETDLALLRLLDGDPEYSALGTSETHARYGQSMLALGYPVTFRNGQSYLNKPMANLRLRAGIIASDLCVPLSGSPIDVFEVDANLHPGMSGGPVLDVKGRLLGIISYGFFRRGLDGLDEPDFTVCIRSSYLARLLRTVSPPSA